MSLSTSPEVLRSILEHIADFVGVCTPQMEPVFVNEAGLRMVGLAPHEVARTPVLEYFWPEDRQMIVDVAVPALTRDGQWSGECRFRHFQTGEPIHTAWNAFVVNDAQGRPVAWATISPNLDRVRRAEQKAAQSEAQFRFLVDSMPQIVWTATPDGAQDFANSRWFEFTGIDPNADPAYAYQVICHPEDMQRTDETWMEAVRSGQPYSCVHRIRRYDGQYRWILSRALPQTDASGRVLRWFGTGTDVTELKLAQEALIRTEKLASVGRLAATVAHEINNPLEAVMNSVYIVRHDPRLPADLRRYLDIADNELQRVAHITRQTLGFYRESSAPNEIQVRELLDGVLTLLTPRLRNKNVRVEKRYSPRIAVTMGLAGEIRQVISNLIANSIDALANGGRLMVRVAPVSLGEREYVRLTVADTGSGISPESRVHLFEPFFTTKETVGTGLGLWVTKGIVDKHGGIIRVRSKERCGTVFCVFLPTRITRP